MPDFRYAKRNAERVLSLIDSLELTEMSTRQLTELYYLVSSIDSEIGTCFLWGEPYDETCKRISSVTVMLSEMLWS